jgi:hypothetical protein
MEFQEQKDSYATLDLDNQKISEISQIFLSFFQRILAQVDCRFFYI